MEAVLDTSALTTLNNDTLTAGKNTKIYSPPQDCTRSSGELDGVKRFSQVLEEHYRCVYARINTLNSRKTCWKEEQQIVNELNTLQDTATILTLDVGGEEVHLSQLTLLKPTAQDSMLSVWLSGEFEWNIEAEEDGLVFIDRDGSLFHAVLDWIRDGRSHLLYESPTSRWWTRCETPDQKQRWVSAMKRESIYFGLTELQKILEEVERARGRRVFDHCFQRHFLAGGEQIRDLLDANPYFCLTDAAAKICMVGLEHQFPAVAVEPNDPRKDSVLQFFFEVLAISAECRIRVGVGCECRIHLVEPDSQEDEQCTMPLYETQNCEWYKAISLRIPEDKEAGVGDVIGSHVVFGRNGNPGILFTCNGVTIKAIPLDVQKGKCFIPSIRLEGAGLAIRTFM
eukprot:TRINITY_DN67147_c0_g2_i1.p1 TRINITY_DN67147_c0_g2~~TRINITY_DN67147_c0_g2_i1.p1  ORF type:complete len:397 (-),score=31.04 TRINITY_DN67147_c0_g2_i1:203-1393(-)